MGCERCGIQIHAPTLLPKSLCIARTPHDNMYVEHRSLNAKEASVAKLGEVIHTLVPQRAIRRLHQHLLSTSYL